MAVRKNIYISIDFNVNTYTGVTVIAIISRIT